MPISRLARILGRGPAGLSTVASGSMWLAVAAVLGQGSMLVANLTVANLLGAQGYGRYALLQTTVLMLAVIAQFSFPIVLARQVAKLRDRDAEAAGEIVSFGFLFAALLGLGLAAILLLFRHWISSELFQDPVQADGLLAIALALPLVAAASIQQGVFIGLQRFRAQAVIGLVLVPLVIALPATGAWLWGLTGAAGGLACAYLLRFALGQAMLLRILGKAGLRWSLGALKPKFDVLRHMALPATLAGGIIAMANWGGQTLLVRSEGGPTVVGLFAAAFTIKAMVMFIPSQMILALLPVLTRFRAIDVADRGRLLWFNTAANFGLTLAICTIGVLLAPRIMGLFGSEFVGGAGVLRILLLAAPLEAITITLNQDLQARAQFWKGLAMTMLPVSLTTLAVAAYLIPTLSASGLAYAWLAGWSVGLVTTFLAVRVNRPAEVALDDRDGDFASGRSAGESSREVRADQRLT